MREKQRTLKKLKKFFFNLIMIEKVVHKNEFFSRK